MSRTSFAVLAAAFVLVLQGSPAAAQKGHCDANCLDGIGDQYRAAYVAHDPHRAPFATVVRFSENNVMLPAFPDGSWDTVAREIGPALTFSDSTTGTIGIYTSVMLTGETPAFLAVRLKVKNSRIIEAEHMLATKRYVSQPPVVFGDVDHLVHDPELSTKLAPGERRSRQEMVALADGYFSTLSQNDGTIRTKFASNCHRIENGREFAADGCEKAFRLGNYAFNARVRDRDYFLVDETRGLVMARAFIDHKGQLVDYKLTDGTPKKSPFLEPHTWSVLEVFKVKNGQIGPIESDFIGVPYYSPSPWKPRR